MSTVVLDASVLVKLFIEEEGSRRAVSAVKKAKALLAPDLLWSEAGNILWKYVRRDELKAEDAAALLRDMLSLPIIVTPSAELVELALQIATQTDRTVYDGLYLALALKENALLLTADQKLVNALAGTTLGKLLKGL